MNEGENQNTIRSDFKCLLFFFRHSRSHDPEHKEGERLLSLKGTHTSSNETMHK